MTRDEFKTIRNNWTKIFMVSQSILHCVHSYSQPEQERNQKRHKSTNVKNKWNKFMKKIKLFDRQFVFYSTVSLANQTRYETKIDNKSIFEVQKSLCVYAVVVYEANETFCWCDHVFNFVSRFEFLLQNKLKLTYSEWAKWKDDARDNTWNESAKKAEDAYKIEQTRYGKAQNTHTYGISESDSNKNNITSNSHGSGKST